MKKSRKMQKRREEEQEQEEDKEEKISVGQWVVVEYEGQVYAGEVKKREGDYRVSVMYKAGPLSIWWKWLTPKDEAFSLRE